jgi:hypothetical protein
MPTRAILGGVLGPGPPPGGSSAVWVVPSLKLLPQKGVLGELRANNCEPETIGDVLGE